MSDIKKEGLRKAALHYHEFPRRGKIEVVPTKPTVTADDLSLAYTPGVAEPCLEIQKDPAMARRYTAKGNLVAVVSNGTAVLGLGNIGALAGKPVMEGKGVLFKRFADVDVFDIEVDSEDPDEVIRTVKSIAPTFGGINLEDIKAPECFYIEETLKRELDIPVFHDDQHGTAIISGAALLNAIELTGKDITKVKLVVSGAGAAGIACANFYVTLGVQLENILMVDTKGVLWEGRGDESKNKYKAKFFRKTKARDLTDAMRGADVFAGVSAKDILTQDMVRSMADAPIIFAMANPDPEISYPAAKEARPDAIIATGRSDYPNQVNNVLGFPFIFRGALDVEATSINEEMKLAAAHSLANLAKEEVPDSVKRAYDHMNLSYGPEYIIPKPFDHRVLVSTSSAVAEAAMRTGVARHHVDIEAYKETLRQKVDWSREFMRNIYVMAKKEPKRIVFPEGDHPKIIWAASEIVEEGYAKPILLAKNKHELLQHFEEMHHSSEGIEIIEPKNWPHREEYVKEYFRLRQRKGVTQSQADFDIRNYFYFGTMMVQQGHADGMVGGISVNYPDVLRPAIKIIGPKRPAKLVAGLFLLRHERKTYVFADAAVNINPTAAQLTEITLMAVEEMERMRIEPRIAMLSFSNFGSVRSPETDKMREAVEMVRKVRPDLMMDGPVQPDVAFNPDFLEEHYPFADLRRRQPNLLIFPNLDAANISLRLVRHMSSANSIGPLIVGLAKPIHLLPKGSEVDNIVNMAAIASVDAQGFMK
ncbi:MAG: NADP-dependent malic enzyme [Saprospiraceae bacterium]|nr:NADP-dependent malic enzyme [Saprospiraceae bacterium]MCF8249781.1 NADP-dependent malic enzyme [Saprospiraceae bacterium]MCF8279266.1 NADP-dependent malic enzyme [Bacteroidales bacterium]MCF8312814.1 NADP-dependent malic enzyme [Saprospiraceae bacterium]MCF8441261.1 NADP-dependent malic enzyme [Saprospiraceae bacterium]